MPIRHGANLAKKGSTCDRRSGLLKNHHVVSVSAMHLKPVLGQIDANRGNLHVDGPLNVIRLRRSPYGTSMPGAGAVYHIRSCHKPNRLNALADIRDPKKVHPSTLFKILAR
jgi:hypothetical protein